MAITCHRCSKFMWHTTRFIQIPDFRFWWSLIARNAPLISGGFPDGKRWYTQRRCQLVLLMCNDSNECLCQYISRVSTMHDCRNLIFSFLWRRNPQWTTPFVCRSWVGFVFRHQVWVIAEDDYGTVCPIRWWKLNPKTLQVIFKCLREITCKLRYPSCHKTGCFWEKTLKGKACVLEQLLAEWLRWWPKQMDAVCVFFPTWPQLVDSTRMFASLVGGFTYLHYLQKY